VGTPTRTRYRLILTPLAARDAQEMHLVLAATDLSRFMGGGPPTLERVQRMSPQAHIY
jgi:hypothetical protein